MKKMLVLVLGAVLTLGMVIPVLGAESGDVDSVTKAYTQVLEAQKDYIDALAEAGQVSSEQAEFMKKNIDIRIEYINSADWDANNTAPFWGMGRRHGARYGAGLMQGFGPGGCGSSFAYGPAPVQ